MSTNSPFDNDLRSKPRPPLQTFTKDKGRVFVAGLQWASLTSKNAKARRAEIAASAELLKADLMVVRTTGEPQVGFGHTRDGMTPGMLSAAAMISKSCELLKLGKNVLVAVKLDDTPNSNWLYFSQYGGVTVPDGDLIDSEQVIRERMIHDLSGPDYDTIVAPSKWGIENSKAMKFSDFYPKDGEDVAYKKWWSLELVTKKVITAPIVIGIVALLLLTCGAGYGYYAYKKQKAAEAAIAMMKQQQAIENEKALHSPAAIPMLAHPWKTIPRALDFASACQKALDSLDNLFPAGWTFQQATCIGHNLEVVWSRPPTGRIDYFKQIEPLATVSPDFQTGRLEIPLAFGPIDEEPLISSPERIIELTDINSTQSFNLILKPPEQPFITPQDPKKPDPNAPRVNWNEQQWTIVALTRPLLPTLRELDANGFRIHSIQTILVNGLMQSNLEGTQYANP